MIKLLEKTNLAKYGWIVFVLSALLSSAFIVVGYSLSGAGFPLDDAWIHQTYARNLALTGRWEFISGQMSAGSTSPLWTMLLSLGFYFGFKTPYLWTTILSACVMGGSVWVVYKMFIYKIRNHFWLIVSGSLLFMLEWHLLWSSGSGMETMLYSFVMLLIAYLLLLNHYWFWVGLLSGLLVWIRPDGITILGPVFLLFIVQRKRKQAIFTDLLQIVLPLSICVFLYGWFNFSLSGSILPNTYYAKQLEYASVLAAPLIERVTKIFLVPVSSAGVFLVPGFIFSCIHAISKRDFWMVSLFLWFIGYGILFAVRLPMVYQHGRYFFPLIPIYYILSICGVNKWLEKVNPKKVNLTKMVLGCAIISACFFAYFAQSSYQSDLRTIQLLMVEPAKWIQKNTSEDSIVAVHDIGAMGYYADRELIDLAGLIQPEIISIIRNESEIKKYLISREVNYLVVFEDWYHDLENFGDEVSTFDYENEKVVINYVGGR